MVRLSKLLLDILIVACEAGSVGVLPAMLMLLLLWLVIVVVVVVVVVVL